MEVLPISSPGFGNQQEICTFLASGRKWMKFYVSIEANVT